MTAKANKAHNVTTLSHSSEPGRRRFQEWTSLFSGKIFVRIVAYIDESGSHDRAGQKKGSSILMVGGWIDWKENWANFCQQWQGVLQKYGVEYFHFYEWVDAVKVVGGRKQTASYSRNPFRELSKKQLDDLLYELAAIGGGGNKIFIGTFMPTKDFQESKKYTPYNKRPLRFEDPYKECLFGLFESFAPEVHQQWPYWTEPVTFIFDQTDNTEWEKTVVEAHAAARKKEPRIAELEFADKKTPPHFALQAADMLVYRMRQIAERYSDPEMRVQASKLDELLINPIFDRAKTDYIKGAIKGSQSILPLRHNKYPWRNKK